jgi:recombination protein RecR
MKLTYTGSLEELIGRLTKLPGIGPKTAQRLAMHLFRMPYDEVHALAQSMVQVKRKVKRCSLCFFVTESDPCSICVDPARDATLLMVVEDSEDVAAVERTGAYRGRYHVLSGVLSPLEGIGPQDLRLDELVARIKTGTVGEVIMAVNPTMEGEATAIYVARLLQPLGVPLTRLARGIPVGGQLNQFDDVTLEKAISGRVRL